jgi:hypothetical protein
MAAIERMPWGKYRGQPLAAIESSYLVWCVESAQAVSEDLRAAILGELQVRYGQQREPCPDGGVAAELIREGVVGGETRRMQVVNAVAAWLRQCSNGGGR